MKLLVVRIRKGGIIAQGETVASVSQGLALFVGIEKGDTDNDVVTMAEKVVHLRIFEDEQGKLNYSVLEKKYDILCISNFTLCADNEKGRRPSFDGAMEKNEANKYFENLVLVLQSKGIKVGKGVFGQHMDIALDLDGPVNITLES